MGGASTSFTITFIKVSIINALCHKGAVYLYTIHKYSDKELECAAVAIEQELNFRNHLIGFDKSLNW